MLATQLRSLIFLSFLIGTLSTLAQDGEDTISVDSSIVVLNATIMDRSGKAVTGLNRSQFRVFEDGGEQEIQSVDPEVTPFAAVILIDTSGSMENRITLARSAAIQFIRGMRPDDVVSIYNFHSTIELVQEFSNDGYLRERAFDLRSKGMTVLNDAVVKAAEVLSRRPEKRRAILVISDGADTMSRRNADYALRSALAANATIYTVDMSLPSGGQRDRLQNQGVLRKFAENSGGIFVQTPGGVAMRDTFTQIVEELGVQYTVTYQPSNTNKNGKWRAIELRVARPGLTIRTRQGYIAPKSK